MFRGATSFNQDLSEWDVSQVYTMFNMFAGATAFNQDLSKWNVLHVTSMPGLFSGATSFTQQLCGVTWVHSKALKRDMFKDSSGSICVPSAMNISADPASLPTTTTMAQPVTQLYLNNLVAVTGIILSASAVLIAIIA